MAFGPWKQNVYPRTMDCVEQRNGGWYVRGTRISLDSVVYSYLRGETPEQTVENFSSLTLEQVKSAVAYYLANQAAVDEYLKQQRIRNEELAAEARRNNPKLHEKLVKARDNLLSRSR